MKTFRLFLAVAFASLCASPPPVAVAQTRAPTIARLAVRPLVVPKGDTVDHVDLIFNGSGAHANAVVVAVAYDSAGRVIRGDRAITWTSQKPQIASVSGASASTTARARGYGSSILTATDHGVSTSILLCVYGPRNPGGVVVTPDTASVTVGTTTQYRASDSTAAPYPPPCVHWSVADSAIARIDRRGLVTGKAASPTSVRVTALVGVP